MSLAQLQWQQLESDEGRVAGCFVSPWLLAKCRVKALAAILIKPRVFWLPQGHCFPATGRELGCDVRIAGTAALVGSVSSDSFPYSMKEDEGISREAFRDQVRSQAVFASQLPGLHQFELNQLTIMKDQSIHTCMFLLPEIRALQLARRPPGLSMSSTGSSVRVTKAELLDSLFYHCFRPIVGSKLLCPYLSSLVYCGCHKTIAAQKYGEYWVKGLKTA